MGGDIDNRIKDLQRRITALGAGTDYGKIWDQTCEMARTMSGYDENGQSMFTDEEWIAEYSRTFMSRQAFIDMKEGKEV